MKNLFSLFKAVTLQTRSSMIALTAVVALLAFSCKSVDKEAVKVASVDESTLDYFIEKGDFKKANEIISHVLKGANLSKADEYIINFEKDKMQRMLNEFTVTDEEALEYIKKYIPDVTEEQMEAWRKHGDLECKTINGKRRYFRKTLSNLFLVNPECVAAREKLEGKETGTTGDFLKDYLPPVIKSSVVTQMKNKDRMATLSNPVKITVHIKMRVMPDAVPAGEVVRMWLPFPKENERQKLIIVERVFNAHNSEYNDLETPKTPEISNGFYTGDYLISSNNNTRRSMYFEMEANGKDTLKVGYDLTFTSFNQYFAFLEERIKPYDTTSVIYKRYTAERERHIVFTKEIKQLADSLVGDATDPYEKVKRIWCWVTENIPWAGARDYSTIPNIPEYVLKHHHGDCGQVSLLFITMARYKGVPARWQSGWMLHPNHVNLHDWAEVYYEGVGWVPVDQSFGYSGGDRDTYAAKGELTEDEQRLKFFFSRGLDAFRYIVNDDYGAWAPLYPAKIYPHFDEVDFQMGEVEWKGGNVLNGSNGWKCWMEAEYSPF
ncbi:MAG: transglutaminase domain-containing protein [Bacteroidales bacterium]|nr:transglutaminase domain-containing protein [Bacteroidales bacterium]